MEDLYFLKGYLDLALKNKNYGSMSQQQSLQPKIKEIYSPMGSLNQHCQDAFMVAWLGLAKKIHGSFGVEYLHSPKGSLTCMQGELQGQHQLDYFWQNGIENTYTLKDHLGLALILPYGQLALVFQYNYKDNMTQLVQKYFIVAGIGYFYLSQNILDLHDSMSKQIAILA